MIIEDIINEKCVTFMTEEPMDNIQSAEYFKENILPNEVEITHDDGNYFEVSVNCKSYYWDKKENCIGAYHPLGFMTQTDAHYLFDKVFTKEFVKEMTDRGYDVTTMKFEISPKLPNYERFNGLSEKYYGKK